MFYYYGAKHRLAPMYPEPLHSTIIEPFAGAAGYSMYWLPRVEDLSTTLVEADARVSDLWIKLLGSSVSDIMEWYVPEVGETTDDWFIMTTATSNGVAGCQRMKVTRRMPDLVASQKRRIVRILDSVRSRVTVIEADYRDVPNTSCTWFVDPPYDHSHRGGAVSGSARPKGMGYGAGCTSDLIDYDELAIWCRGRDGQVIVAEQQGASWLPFAPLVSHHDSLGRPSAEVVWVQPDVAPDGCMV
jgi:hypothetical protein